MSVVAARPDARPTRRRGLVLVVAASVTLALSVTGCATHDALGLAQRACTKVDSALALYARSQQGAPGPQAGADAAASLVQLRAALPIAAVAAGESAQWQALMTTLTEAGRVPEGYLIHALTTQCAPAEDNGSAGT